MRRGPERQLPGLTTRRNVVSASDPPPPAPEVPRHSGQGQAPATAPRAAEQPAGKPAETQAEPVDQATATAPTPPTPESPARPGRQPPRARFRDRFRAHARIRSAPALRRLLRFVRQPYLEPADPAYVVRRWPDLTALCAATVFFWLSLTPSLVPRPWYLQGVIGGITASIGYALGALTGTLIRTALRHLLPRRLRRSLRRLLRARRGRLRPVRLRRAVTTRPYGPDSPIDVHRARARAWQCYFVLSPLLTIYCLSESARMQRDLRRLQELPESLTWHSMMITLMAGTLCALLLLLARAIRLGTRALIRGLGRFVPRPVAVVAGLLISATLVTVGSRDVVFDRGVVGIVSRVAAATDQSTKDGITQSGSRYVSGSPHSLVRWDDLGYEGRNFTGSTPSRARIAEVTGRPARAPVRVYVGQRAADTYAARARLAVAELERTGGFQREVLAIAGTTGRGWVNSTDAEPLEYMYGGDTAIVAMQYSYLPSWLSFLLDREQAGKANKALLEAVVERLRQLPEEERPKLAVFGESLGAYGVEAAFGNADELLSTVDGAVFAGSPHASPIRRELTENRDPGSPVWRPEYEDGRHFRFAQYPEVDLARPEAEWESPRVVFLQNASDPIVWWSPDLAVNPPRWLREPLGPDITTEVNWAPFVTFWQTTVDMAVSYSVSAPHGHRYGTASVTAWAKVLPPDDGWTGKDTRRLQEFMDKREAPY